MTLFIGLGGVGTETLDYLYNKMDTYNEDLKTQNKSEVSAYFYYVDTLNSRYIQSSQEFMGGSNKSFHQIGSRSPESIKNALRRGSNGNDEDKAGYELLQKWYDAPAKQTDMTIGADAVRQYSRLAFVRESSAIRGELETLIRQVIDEKGRIYVITGSVGGTGSGIYMDVLYMISEIYSYITNGTMSPDVRLIMAMPEGYIAGGTDAAHKKMKLNAFASLSELDAICKDKDSDPSLFNGCYIGGRKKEGKFQPFRFGYLFDSAGQARDEVSQKLSDFLFELELAGNPNEGLNQEGQYTGSHFDSLLTNSVDANWNLSKNNGYVKAFNAMGQYSIETPDFLYRSYFTSRLLYDVFYKGLKGEKGMVDEGLITRLAEKFKESFDEEIVNTCNTIKANYISKKDFENDTKADITFSVFSKAPNKQEETVKNILEKKDVLLQTIRDKVYCQCRDWLGQYDFSTVYAILKKLDIEAYREAKETNQHFEELKQKAREASQSGISLGGLFSSKSVNPEKALKQFDPLLHSWLTFEVNKALSSGIGVDISVQDQGYLDYCKSFIDNAKNRLDLTREQQHWDETFIKDVSDLKIKDDRSYIPDLSTIVNEQNEIIPAPDSPMVSIYENSFVQVRNDDILHGTCTPVTLHEKIICGMKSNASLKSEGIDMNEIFDPTPGKTNSLRSESKAALFVQKYVRAAENQINLLLKENQEYQGLFVEDILSRLQHLPEGDKKRKCQGFAQYNQVQLNTEDMTPGAVTQFTYYIIGSDANMPLMQDLGILDRAGQKCTNTDHTPDNSFFKDKIVKLIIKSGYKIDDYRYFDEYKRNVQEKMDRNMNHDPFIDKRFLNELDENGKYPCDVSAALTKIAKDESAQQQATKYSLDGFNDVEIYKFCLALLFEYFNILKSDGKIETDLSGAISHTAGTRELSIQQPTYNKLRRKYILSSPKSIDLTTLSTINNMEDLTNWIQYVMSKKSFINNEAELYGQALEDFNLHFAEELESAIGEMMGDGNKPVYDFFTAYLDWYNKD